MNFPYTAYSVEPTPTQPDVTVVYRPVIAIRIVGPAGETRFRGLLDSGADETVLPKALADVVGVVVDPLQTGTADSASGPMAVNYGRVTLELEKGRERYRWNTMVAIADQPWQEAILGHIGFLRHFDVEFRGEKRDVRLKRNRLPFESLGRK
jgi:hypothetical protein